MRSSCRILLPQCKLPIHSLISILIKVQSKTPGVCAARLSFSLPTSYHVSPASATQDLVTLAVATIDPATATSAPAETLPSLIASGASGLSTSTIQIALAPGVPSATAIGMGEVVSATTEGTMVPEMTAPVDMMNLTNLNTNSTADGVAAASVPTYMQASGGVMNSNVWLGALAGVAAFATLFL